MSTHEHPRSRPDEQEGRSRLFWLDQMSKDQSLVVMVVPGWFSALHFPYSAKPNSAITVLSWYGVVRPGECFGNLLTGTVLAVKVVGPCSWSTS